MIRFASDECHAPSLLRLFTLVLLPLHFLSAFSASWIYLGGVALLFSGAYFFTSHSIWSFLIILRFSTRCPNFRVSVVRNIGNPG